MCPNDGKNAMKYKLVVLDGSLNLMANIMWHII